MNAQEAYNKMRHWFTLPGAVLGQTDDGFCAYRGTNEHGDYDKLSNVRCAVGCLIPNDLYSPYMDSGEQGDGMQAGQLLDYYPDVRKLFDDDLAMEFVQKAQTRHDDSSTVDQFIEKLDRLADDYGLMTHAT